MSRGRVSLVTASAVALLFLATAARGQERPAAGALFEAMLPGGARAALAALDDPGPADRALFLVDAIRRFHSQPGSSQTDPGLATLLSHLRSAARSDTRESVPLPLPPATWNEAVFGGRATPDTLLVSILGSRAASLLYIGLLHLDDRTREWLATEPGLVSELASDSTAAIFLVAAPGLRVHDGRMVLPGGSPADPVWMALTGVSADRPGEFVRRVLELRRGRFAYFLASMAQLSPSEIRYALKLDAPDPADRVAAAERLLAVFDRLARHWLIQHLPFWRPTPDPGLLLKDLRTDEHGTPVLPGSLRFWNEVFDNLRVGEHRVAEGGATHGPLEAPVDFIWLCERVFSSDPMFRARLHKLVLFASRRVTQSVPAETFADAVTAVRAAGQYPALSAALERAGLADLRAYAAAARRAEQLNRIGDRARAVRALQQFQGALAVIARSSFRGGLAAEALPSLVTTLAAIEVSKKGDYEGRLVRWLEDHLLRGKAGASAEDVLVGLLAGSAPVRHRFVDWEGTRYRVDLSTPESNRLTTLLDDFARPFVSAARTLIAVAETLERGALTPADLRDAANRAVEAHGAFDTRLLDRYAPGHHRVVSRLQRTLRERASADRAARDVRLLADSFLAAGLLELTYAAALGQPGATPISVSDAASRHEFGPRRSRSPAIAWMLPEAGGWAERGWHVQGSLLGLDVRLAAFSLLRISLRPPTRKPSLNETDRRVFTEAVSLIDPGALHESRREALLLALRAGRARVAGVGSPTDAMALAKEARMGALQQDLLAWTAVHEPERVPSAFSLTELVWLGAGPSATPPALDAWGAPGEPRTGCLCLRQAVRGGRDLLSGRWHTGMFAGDFPDLNLRLSELLAELDMPAVLLGAVLAPATIDFVENVNSRHQDDRRGLGDFVQALTRERVEEYLALLTTDGPLVPVGEAETSAQTRDRR